MIQGKVLLPDDRPCSFGIAFAWDAGLAPETEDFEHCLQAENQAVLASRIGPDGTFALQGLDSARSYTLSAVAPGLACPKRLTNVLPGAVAMEIRLMYLYGAAILLEEPGGHPLRTSPAFFGRGPDAAGPGKKLHETPPELGALGIAGLNGGHGTRDRWQYLALSEIELPELGPLVYRVQVPGYEAKEERLHVRPLIDRLYEVRVTLVPKAQDWSVISVQLFGAAPVLDLALPDEELIGTVELVRDGDEDWAERTIGFAVHARALRAPEAIGSLPRGTYSARFLAEDSYYVTDAMALELLPAAHALEFDVSDAGTLLVDVQAEGAPYDRRWVMRMNLANGVHFYSTFDAGPYVVPFLFPGNYRMAEATAPGHACRPEHERLIEILAGELTVEFLPCWAAVPTGAPRR